MFLQVGRFFAELNFLRVFVEVGLPRAGYNIGNIGNNEEIALTVHLKSLYFLALGYVYVTQAGIPLTVLVTVSFD